MQLLRRQQGKTASKIEAGLRAKDRDRAHARAIAARLSLFEHEPEEIVILAHLIWSDSRIESAQVWRLRYLDRRRWRGRHREGARRITSTDHPRSHVAEDVGPGSLQNFK